MVDGRLEIMQGSFVPWIRTVRVGWKRRVFLFYALELVFGNATGS